MFLKRIVKLPVLGVKVEPKPFTEKTFAYREYLERRRN
jgi:hypothetical protein